jgi:hypothetical protein
MYLGGRFVEGNQDVRVEAQQRVTRRCPLVRWKRPPGLPHPRRRKTHRRAALSHCGAVYGAAMVRKARASAGMSCSRRG